MHACMDLLRMMTLTTLILAPALLDGSGRKVSQLPYYLLWTAESNNSRWRDPIKITGVKRDWMEDLEDFIWHWGYASAAAGDFSRIVVAQDGTCKFKLAISFPQPLEFTRTLAFMVTYVKTDSKQIEIWDKPRKLKISWTTLVTVKCHLNPNTIMDYSPRPQ